MRCSCGSTNFLDNDGGGLMCVDCHEILTEQEKDMDLGFSQSRATLRIVEEKTKSEKTAEKKEWCLYDGFNFILLKMTDSLIKCGASEDLKLTVFKLWVAYIENLNVAFQRPEHLLGEGEESNNDGGDELNPIWMSQLVEEKEGKPSDPKVQLPFAPIKLNLKRLRKRRRVEDLCSIPDSELTEAEIRSKMRKIKKNFSRISVQESMHESMQDSMRELMQESGCDTATEPDLEQTCADEEINDPNAETYPKSRSSRFWILKKIADEHTDDAVSVCSTKRKSYRDPEVLTLHKLLSFLHAAVILNCESISSSDILRWVREGHIALYGAHQMLPPDMPLSGHDAINFGGVGASRSTGVPNSEIFRYNTARLLDMLGVTDIQLPPLFNIVAKIVQDLQLPHELNKYVQKLDEIVSRATLGIPTGDSWLPLKLGLTVRNVETHAAALILIAMKLMLGLDDATEYKTSEFADKVNRILELKPSSLLASTTSDYSASRNAIPTLFVWDEWVRFIEYRRTVLERNHVPTAIRAGLVSQMDPEILLRYAENEGVFRFHRNKESIPNDISQILDDYSSHHPDRSDEDQTSPSFQPTSLATQGLAHQLYEHDPNRFRFLEQRFEESSLAFTLNQEELAAQLKNSETATPHNLNVCHGPAYEDVELVTAYVAVGAVTSTTKTTSKKSLERVPCQRKRKAPIPEPTSQPEKFKLKREISSACCFSDEEDDSSQSHPSLMLHLPSSNYWSRSGKFNKTTDADWEVLSSQLPATFVWLLNLICQIIEESPKQVYVRVCSMETIIFQKYTKLLYTVTESEELKHRLVQALRSYSQHPRSTI